MTFTLAQGKPRHECRTWFVATARPCSVSRLLQVVACFHILRHLTAANVWRSSVSFVCVGPPRLDQFVRTALSNWDTTMHFHLAVSSKHFQSCCPDRSGSRDSSSFVHQCHFQPTFHRRARSLSRVPHTIQAFSCLRRHHLDHRSPARIT